MAQEGNTAFQELFAMASPAESIKLLPWCASSAFPSCYTSEALAAATQLSKNVPATTTAPKQEESTTPGPFHSPAHLSETPYPSIPLLPDLPFIDTPPVGCPFAEFLAISTFPVVHSTFIMARGPVLTPRRLKL